MLRAFNNYCNDVEPTFEQQPTLETPFAYLETFWIWGLMPLAFWNVFDRPVALRTTNKCESWNRGWNKSVGTPFPIFWNVLKKLTEQELASRLDMRKISGGEPPRKKKLKYIILDEKILRLKNSYPDGNISVDMYWDGISAICRCL